MFYPAILFLTHSFLTACKLSAKQWTELKEELDVER